MSERFFRSNRLGYPHPVSSELENSGIRVAVGDCSVTEGMRPQLILLYSLIIRSSMKLFSQRSRQFILSFFQVFEA